MVYGSAVWMVLNLPSQLWLYSGMFQINQCSFDIIIIAILIPIASCIFRMFYIFQKSLLLLLSLLFELYTNFVGMKGIYMSKHRDIRKLTKVTLHINGKNQFWIYHLLINFFGWIKIL